MGAMRRDLGRAALAGVVAAWMAGCGGADAGGPDPAADAGRLTVSFLLDEALTQGLYLGDRWVSPPTYTAVQDAEIASIEARVERDGGQATDRPFEWTSGDVDVVEIAPATGPRVTLVVRKPGATTITVVQGGAVRVLTLDAARSATRWEIAISREVDSP